ncbi:MAG: hypothetical protein PHO27_03750 [Sulfuricurvum sp.]|nr:hypothetical protein [Sulfuricurvum sp.]
MKTLIFFFLILTTVLFAEPSVLTEAPQESSSSANDSAPANNEQPASDINNLFSGVNNSLTMQYSKVPDRAYIGEIVALSVKLTPIDVASGNIEYSFANDVGIRVFSDTPHRSVKEDGVYDTFYFLVQSSSVRLPDITATVTSSGATSQTLTGSSFSASPLSPPSTYANILADKFEIINYKTTPYNNESNIVIFTVKASRCNISDFSLPNAIKQGFESKLPNVNESQMTYYVVIPDSEQTLNFAYFNLQKQRYESLVIPIVVDDDTVSTQSDLSPTDDRHTGLKIGASLFLVAVLAMLFYWRRQKWFLYLSILPMFYIVYSLLPNGNICVKKDAPIYLLPINHGTVFETTTQEEHLEAEKEVGDFTKVHLSNGKVGWVNKHDICTN